MIKKAQTIITTYHYVFIHTHTHTHTGTGCIKKSIISKIMHLMHSLTKMTQRYTHLDCGFTTLILPFAKYCTSPICLLPPTKTLWSWWSSMSLSLQGVNSYVEDVLHETHQLWPLVKPLLDRRQFAHHPKLEVEDAIIYLLKRVNLENPVSTVRVMFFDLSSAFNTISPTLFGQKLSAMQVDSPLVTWNIDYLIGRPQYVCLQHCVSDRLVNTRAPQGTVPSPFLFTLYTTDLNYCTKTCHLQKFSDGSAKVGCISEGVDEFRTAVDNFVTWPLQEGTKSSLFSETAEVLPHLLDYSQDVLGVCGGQCCPLCCCVLGQNRLTCRAIDGLGNCTLQ